MSETSLSELAVYTARPTVRIDAEAYPIVSESIVAMEMTEREGGLSALELRVGNWASNPSGGVDFAFEDDSILKLGATIAIYSGDERAPQEIFQGVITGLEAIFSDAGAPELIVLAEDALQQARMTRRTVTHTDATIAALARDLAGQLGLTPVITGLSDNIGVQVQLNESDLAFLRRMLARYDGDLQVVGRELHVSPRGDVRRGQLELRFNGQLRRARALADLAHQVTEITVSGWDAAQGRRITGRSTGAHAGPGAGRSGADLLHQTIGERAHHIGHLAVTDSAEAQALADAAFDSRARQFVTIEGTAEGNAALRVGSHVSLHGLGGRFDNTYYVVRTCHRFDLQRGYETDFTAECAFLGAG
jgi:phage protein D